MISKSTFKIIPLEERIVLDAALTGAILHVVNGNDSGAGSLRDAINTADHSSAPDTILFTLSKTFNGTVNLTSGPLVLTRAMTINGSGAVTVNGAPASDVFDVNTSGATLEGLTIVGQTQPLNAGAGVALNGSNNLVTNDTIIGNYQGVLDKAGSNTISSDFIGTNAAGSTTSGNAFGVYLNGTGYDTISNDVISGNYADTVTYNFTSYSTPPRMGMGPPPGMGPPGMGPPMGPVPYTPLMGGGIWIASSNAGHDLIENNLLGTNASATTTIANDIGLYSRAGNNTFTGNTVAGYQVMGVLFDAGANSNVISHNLFDLAFNSKGQAHILQAAPEQDFVSQISSLYLISSNNSVFSNNFAGITMFDIQLAAGANGNDIESNLMGATSAGQAAAGWGGPDSVDIYTGQISNTIIRNNTMLNATSSMIVINGVDNFNGPILPAQNLLISNNTMADPAIVNNPTLFETAAVVLNTLNVTETGNKFSQLNQGGITNMNDQNLLLSNNTITNLGPDADAILNTFIQNMTIINNTITNNVSSPSTIGIYDFGIQNFTIANNSVSNETIWGIFVCTSNNGLVTNNIIQNIILPIFTVGAGDQFVAGIRICDDNNQILVSNNIVLNSTTGLALGGNDQNITFSNDLLINDTLGFYIAYSGSQNIVLTNTIISGGQYGFYVDNNPVNISTGNNQVTIQNTIINGESQAAVYVDSSANSISLNNDILSNNKYGIFDLSTTVHDVLIDDVLFLNDMFNYNY